MDEDKSELELAEEWGAKFKEKMEEIVSLHMQANPNADPQSLKEEYLLNKIATIYVGSVALGRKVRELESKLNEISKNT